MSVSLYGIEDNIKRLIADNNRLEAELKALKGDAYKTAFDEGFKKGEESGRYHARREIRDWFRDLIDV